jgi:hypothetical protein
MLQQLAVEHLPMKLGMEVLILDMTLPLNRTDFQVYEKDYLDEMEKVEVPPLNLHPSPRDPQACLQLHLH